MSNRRTPFEMLDDEPRRGRRRRPNFSWLGTGVFGLIALFALLVVAAYVAYNFCRIDVPAEHIAVLTKKTGKDLENDQEIAPDSGYKGLQPNVLTEGRYFYNPYNWDWSVYKMVEIPEGKLGVRVRLYGKNLPYGDFVVPEGATDAAQPNDSFKGIVREVLRPGRHAINAIVRDADGKLHERRKSDHAEIIEIHDVVNIPAGFKGVVTNLAGPLPENPNQFLVPRGSRGVQEETLEEGTHYLNPYRYRVQAIDCRSQKFNLSDGFDLGFPSKDGFWVSLDGAVEFRVDPEKAATVYVMYDEANQNEGNVSRIDEEIIRKVIMPNARSFCRLRGSDSTGRDFIGGETRSQFQADFQKAIKETCAKQGIKIVQALITKINPPQAIMAPVRAREVASQELMQYEQEKLQQDEEAKLAKEVALVEQVQRLVEADQEVVKLMSEAKRRQEVALAEANRDKSVADEELKAAQDKAAAILAQKKAEAAVVNFANEADAAGWKAAVNALDGDGQAFARFVLYQKLAPGYKSIMTNTADSPLMKIFDNFANGPKEETADAPDEVSAGETEFSPDDDDDLFNDK